MFIQPPNVRCQVIYGECFLSVRLDTVGGFFVCRFHCAGESPGLDPWEANRPILSYVPAPKWLFKCEKALVSTATLKDSLGTSYTALHGENTGLGHEAT